MLLEHAAFLKLLSLAAFPVVQSTYWVARKAVTSLICCGVRFFELSCMISLARALDANASN